MLSVLAGIGFTAGLVLIGALAYQAMKGYSGTLARLKTIAGASAAFFALLAVTGAIQYVDADLYTWPALVSQGFAWLFALAAFGAFKLYQNVDRAERGAKAMATGGASTGVVTSPAKVSVKPVKISIRRRGAGAPDAGLLPADVPVVKDDNWTSHARTVRFAPQGDLGEASASGIGEYIAKTCAEGPAKIVIDFTKVTSLNSAVVDSIVESYRRFPHSKFTIVAPVDTPPYRELMLLGIDQMIPVYPVSP